MLGIAVNLFNRLAAGRILAGLFGLLICAAAFSQTPALGETIDTSAPRAFLFEPSSGTILFAKAADERFAPGSLAKIMTAATVFQAIADAEMRLDTICEISEHAWRTGGAPAGRTTMFAEIHSEVPVEDLLKGLLVHNGNDSAIALAECLDGSEGTFARRMTELAATIGMTNSRFANPTGYPDPNSYTSARDMVWLADYVLKEHRQHYHLFSLPDFEWNKIFQRNKNPMIGEVRGLDGLGGGYDEEDGYAGLATVVRDGRRVVAVTAGTPSAKSRIKTIKEVIEGAWEFFSVQTLYSKGEHVADASVFGATIGTVPLVAANNFDVLLPRGGTLDFRLRVVYKGPLVAPFEPGAEAGELRVIGQDGIVYRGKLVTGEGRQAGTMTNRALDGLGMLLFGWI